MTRKRLNPEERKSQILAVAMDVAEERGFLLATHKHVAKKAKCSISLVFKYFVCTETLRKELAAELLTNGGNRSLANTEAEVFTKRNK